MTVNILLANINYPYYGKQDSSNFLSIIFDKNILKSLPRPLNFPILASLTPEDCKVDIKNWVRYQDINFNDDYDLIGLSCTTDYVLDAYKIADEFRRLGKTVVIGGWHASALPEEVKEHADSVVIGEAEEIWTLLLNDFKNKNIKPFYNPIKPADIKKIPILKSSSKNGIQATRGCPYGCEFCSITNMKFRNKFRTRAVEDVIEEIKSLKNDFFFFYDNSFTINPQYSKNLFREMIGLNKKFTAFGNINVLGTDEEFLRLANEAGCIGWFVGFESILQKTLNSVGKTTNKVKEYAPSVKKIHDYNMYVTGSFLFGFDTDTIDVFDATLNAIKHIEIDNPLFGPLIPYPGTPLFEKFEKEGRILTKNWAKYTNENVVFQPKNMSPQELLINSKRIHKEVYTYSNIIHRTLRSLKLGVPISLKIGKMNITNRFAF